ncbi:MAG TPA: ATP-binding protein [Vicinamibacterales bacterium]|nr:ATP-binding protein [Vicinamibacterales bacterium]
MRRALRHPPRPLPDWWPPGRPWPPVDLTPRGPMPAWWPRGESWPPKTGREQPSDVRRFPIRVAILFAIGLNLIAAGLAALIRLVAGPLGLNPIVGGSWPLSASVAIVAIAWLFVVAMRRIGTPLSDLVMAADRVAAGDLSVRLDEQGLPWLGSVARAFNSMTLRLERQQRDRRALMADIAHELRTPLSVIQGRVEGMLDGVYPRDEHHVRQLLEETRMLARLIEDLRTSASLDAGTLALQPENTDLDVLIEDAVDAFRPEAERRELQLIVQTGDLPLLRVDPFRIKEVLSNLLSNALRYSPDGGVVRIEALERPEEVVVRVTDQGPGISSEDLPRVFDRFYKGATSKGTGLGLAIAKSLVEAHGGTIAAQSGPGVGTTIVFTLPQ